MENSPMVLQHDSFHGGRTPRSVVKHYHSYLETVIVAHRVSTINGRVTAADVYGIHRGPLPTRMQIMEDLQYPAGAPNDDPRCTLPARMLLLLVNRFSCPGDTVLDIGVESTQLPEVVLDRGRRLELYLTDKHDTASVQQRIETAFLKSFNSGNFQVDTGVQVFAGPDVLPPGLPPDMTPQGPKESLRTEDNLGHYGPRHAPVWIRHQGENFSEAQKIHQLFISKSSVYPDMPLWGTLVAYDLPQAAINSLVSDEGEE